MEGTRNASDPTRNAQSYAQDSTPEVCGTDWSCRNVQHACYQRRSERQQFWSNREYLPDRRSEEHTSELQSLMRNSYAVFCLKKKTQNKQQDKTQQNITHSQSTIHNHQTN